MYSPMQCIYFVFTRAADVCQRVFRKNFRMSGTGFSQRLQRFFGNRRLFVLPAAGVHAFHQADEGHGHGDDDAADDAAQTNEHDGLSSEVMAATALSTSSS